MSLCGPPSSTQIQAGSEGAGSGRGGQSPVQTGVWGQDRESADGGGAPEETEVVDDNNAICLIHLPAILNSKQRRGGGIAEDSRTKLLQKFHSFPQNQTCTIALLTNARKHW